MNGASIHFARLGAVLRLFLLALSVLGFGALVGCKDPPVVKLSPKSETSTELRAVRRGVSVTHPGEEARAPYARERLGLGAKITIDRGGLAWIRRDGGTTLLVRGPGSLEVDQAGLRVTEGAVFAEAPAGVTESLLVPEGTIVLSAVRASVEVGGGKTAAYVLDGEVRAAGSVARAGQLLELAGDKASVTPKLAWEDWTGGLATTDAQSAPAPFGVGTVGARTPGASGTPHSPLTIARLDVRVTIDGDFAVTEVDQTFFNPLSETVEGIYKLRVPDGALLERFGVDREGGILYGYVKEKKQAEAQYQAHVYQGSTEDPALLSWSAPGVYEARLYPIGPGATRRVVARYTEWLGRSGKKGERRLYVYPMASEGSTASAPHVDDLSVEIDLSKAGAKDIRSGMGAVRVGDTLVIRSHDLVPRADLALELFDEGSDQVHAARARHTADLVALGAEEQKDARRQGSGEAEYLLVGVRATDLPKREEGLDLVIVVDSSAATDEATLRLARATTRALLAHLGEKDRVLVLAGDDRLRPIAAGEAELAKVDPERAKRLLDALAHVEPGGATDLAAMLSEAIGKIGKDRASAIVYVGDGQPTVGEADLASIREKLKKAPRAARIFSLGLGDGANMALLAGLSSGGFAERVGDERAAARAALRLLEVAERAVDLGATADLGGTVERVYPREFGALVDGETTLVVGRLTGEPPKTITIKTERGESTRDLAIRSLDDAGDLRRRWAQGRLDQLLDEAAGRAAVVDLGVRQGIVTPYTSIYVPTSQEMTPDQRNQIDRRPRVRAKVPARALEGKESDEAEEEQAEDKKNKDKEGGTGTRAKGEEGLMGKLLRGNSKSDSAPAATPPATQAAATASPTAAAPEPVAASPAPRDPSGPADAPDDARRELKAQLEEAESAPAKSKKVAPSGGDDFGGIPGAPPAPPKPSPGPDSGGGFGSGSGRLGGTHRTKPTCNPGDPLCDGGASTPTSRPLESTVDIDGRVDLAPPRLDSGELDSLSKGGLGFGAGGAKDNEAPAQHAAFIGAKQVVIIVDDPGRIKRWCGPGANLPFNEKRGLWRERLAAANGSPSAVVAVYRRALALCEAPTLRERRALLLLGLDFLPDVRSRVSFYRLLTKDVGAADVVYRGILSRVTTAEQVRELNRALGLATADPDTVAKAEKDATSPSDRVIRLRALMARFPDDLTLALRLLDALEDASDPSGARTFAKTLKKRRDADIRVRTAVGELFLRLAKAAEGEQREADEGDAKRAFGEIVEFSPDDPVARRRLGDLYRAHGYFAEAARQYETLGRLLPDDPTVAILLAACAEGQGKLEEAVRWTEKGGQAGAPDASQGPHATARAYAATFLAWGRKTARAEGKTDEVTALLSRLDRVLGGNADRREAKIRVVLTWSHPEFHPTLWTNALGSLMPAPEGDVTLGIAQSMLQDRAGGLAEIRVEPTDLEHAARIGAQATLTVVFGEGKDSEVIERREVGFARGGQSTLRFRIEGSKLEEVVQ